MENFYNILKENKQEAFELLKKVGGRIDFAGNFNEEDGSFNDNSIGDCPAIIFGDVRLVDGIALAVKLGEEPNTIEFYGYDCEDDAVGWMDTESCIQNTENEIYLAIDGWCEEHGIRLE